MGHKQWNTVTSSSLWMQKASSFSSQSFSISFAHIFLFLFLFLSRIDFIDWLLTVSGL